MRWVKSPSKSTLEDYRGLKVLSWRCVDKAREDWWEAKVEEAERLHETAVRLGHGGSLPKDLKFLKSRQKIKADSMLLAQNGTELCSAVDKVGKMVGTLYTSE